MKDALGALDFNIIGATKCCLKNWTSEGGCRAVNALYYIVDGTADLKIGQKEYHLKKGDLAICPLSLNESYNKTSDILEKYFVHFQLNIDMIPCFANYEFEYVVNVGYKKELAEKFDLICKGAGEKTLFNTFESWESLIYILSEFFKNVRLSEKRLSKSEYKAWKALGYITCNPMRKTCIKEVAHFVGVHEKHLSKIFKSTFDETINYYINYAKIEYITTIVAYRDILLKEVADLSNYSNYGSMKKWFYKFRGLDIKDYKLSHFSKKNVSGETYENMLSVKWGKEFYLSGEFEKQNETGYVFIIEKGRLMLKTKGETLLANAGEAVFAGEKTEFSLEMPQSGKVFVLPVKISAYGGVLCIKKAEEFNSLSEYGFLKREQKIISLLKNLMEEEKVVYDGADMFNPILRYIEENLKDELTVGAVAEHFHVNGKMLSRVFKEKTGRGFNEHLSEIKYKKALELMCDKEKSIPKIAREVGFASYEGFRRFIKRKSGMFPKRLREELLSDENGIGRELNL